MENTTQGNELFKACYNASLNEMRLIAMISKAFNPDMPRTVTISIHEWNNTFETKHRNGKSKVTKALAALQQLSMTFEGVEVNAMVKYHRTIKSTPTLTSIIITLPQELVGFYTKLNAILCDQNYEKLRALSSASSIRLFLWIAATRYENPNASRLILSMNWLREQLCMLNKQKCPTRFKQVTIETPLSHINSNTGMMIENDYISNGRRVHAVQLTFA